MRIGRLIIDAGDVAKIGAAIALAVTLAAAGAGEQPKKGEHHAISSKARTVGRDRIAELIERTERGENLKAQCWVSRHGKRLPCGRD